MTTPKRQSTNASGKEKVESEALESIGIQLARPVRTVAPELTNQNSQSSASDEAAEFTQEDPFKDRKFPQRDVQFRDKSTLEKRRQNVAILAGIFFGCLIVLFLAIFLSIKFVPEARRWLRIKVESTRQLLTTIPQSTPILPLLDAIDKSLSVKGAPGSERAAKLPWDGMGCRFLIQEALSRKLNQTLDIEGKYLFGGCQLVNDMPQIALKYLNDGTMAINTPQKISSGWRDLPILLLAEDSKLRLHILDDVTNSTSPFCPQWKVSPHCIQKYIRQARLPFQNQHDKAFSILDNGISNQPLRLKIWVNWAGGLVAIKEGNAKEAEVRLAKATNYLRKSFDPFLEKEVFRARIRNAWLHHDVELMQAVWKDKPKKSMQEDPAGYLDIELMYISLLEPDQSRKKIKNFLASPESYQRYRYDSYFVQWVVEQSIAMHAAPEGWIYLNHLLEFSQKATQVSIGEWLIVLQMRLLVAEGKGIEALQIAQNFEKMGQKSAVVQHLKGLAFLQAFATKNYQLKAAHEFQKALNMGAQWESYFAMVLVFLEAGENLKAEATLSYWQRDALRSRDKAWVGLARGLIRYRTGETAGAIQQWKELALEFPSFDPVQKLNQMFVTDAKFLENGIFSNLSSLLTPYSPLGALVFIRHNS